MASLRLKRVENVAGDFFVDETCIDCDLCRQIAPETFADVEGQSAVVRQPATPDGELEALKALVTCPTSSIGARGHSARAAARAYPESIAGDVFFCGFAAESSFGAASYLVVRPEGNVLVDSPRFNEPLAKRIDALGGVDLMFLTHRDDVADHAAWSKRFGARRVVHTRDANGALRSAEWLLEGEEPVELGDGLLAIPTPGHTRGHAVLLYRDAVLFSGDHLWWSPRYESLNASRSVCWYSWDEQTRSMERLRDYTFEWVFPGHGRRTHLPAAEMRRHLDACIARMRHQSRPR